MLQKPRSGRKCSGNLWNMLGNQDLSTKLHHWLFMNLRSGEAIFVHDVVLFVFDEKGLFKGNDG